MGASYQARHGNETLFFLSTDVAAPCLLINLISRAFYHLFTVVREETVSSHIESNLPECYVPDISYTPN